MGLYSSGDIPDLTNFEIFVRTSNAKCVQDNYGIICKKMQLLKEIHILVKALNKIDNEPGDEFATNLEGN